MESQSLRQYTQNEQLCGQSSTQILTRFIAYANICRDPFNILKYMQSKIICTYLAHYWLYKSQLLIEIGEYEGGYQAIKIAKERYLIEPEEPIDFQAVKSSCISSLVDVVKKYPLKGTRTIEEYSLFNNKSLTLSQQQVPQLFHIYHTKYQPIATQLQKAFYEKRKDKPESWMLQIYKNQPHLQSRIKSISTHSFIIDDAYSLTTPAKRKNYIRTSKPLDSVQLFKRKQKQSKYKNSRNNNQQYTNSLYNSLPVGRHFNNLRKTVTFTDSKQQVLPNSLQPKRKPSLKPIIKLGLKQPNDN